MKARFGNCEIDTDARRLCRDGEIVDMEPQVFDVLATLIDSKDRVLSKDDLIERVWGGRIVSDTAVTSRIKAVRGAVGDDGVAQRVIRTIRGVGYQFVADLEMNSDNVVALDEKPDQPLVLVLPFTQVPNDPTSLWRLDGICDDVISALSRFRDLRVISRLTSFGLRDLAASEMSQAVEELGAEYLVEGALRQRGEGWRIQVSLIALKTQTQIWSERWELSSEDLQDLDAYIDRIAAAIEPELLSAERDRVRRLSETDLSTWETTQRGLWLLWQQRPGLHAKAVAILQEAINRDPEYALAHAGLAYALCHAHKEGVVGDEALDQALAAARRAVQLDPRDAFAYVALGRSHLARAEFDASIAAYDEAIARNPNHAYGHFGRGYSLCLSGRPTEAIDHFERVLELSPRDPQGWSVCVMLCFSCLLTNRTHDALGWARKAQQMPNAPHWALAAEAAALKSLGRKAEAEKSLRRALIARPDLDAAFLDRAYPFAARQDYDKLAGLMLGTFVPVASGEEIST
ncbi:tetratricopeptide repeat protein [Roseovarius faecimaris]|uniref:Tetratricopeptide repeat protein n=1 Tax=Roseovarius faecimaris TaxID=2494550 RepID=A0A6I6IN19_9RHOB|nr:winged helix-turn-helix domain-containing protein [Roseovarius faecimaris]QGX97484.1 tetratricopeptide repeat protein [Roseovarius faecimaris]